MKIQNQPTLPRQSNFSNYSKADQEILNDLYAKGDLRENADVGKLLQEYKASLNGAPRVESFTGYHSYEEMNAALQDLAARFPDKAAVVSLGKSGEGREIYALRVGTPDEASPKPGVVITGCHHAREWMTVEVPLHTATNMLENYETDPASKERVDKTVTWFVPMVNPDGYEYSRTKNSWWRKTRRPITETGCPNMKGNMGVDPNRNYWDGKPEHFEIYRPAGDTPCSTADDFGDGKTSDNPKADTYRGPSGGSEPEVQAMLNLELNPANNIKGVVDYHSYGDMILYPYGSKELAPDRLEIYRDIGGKMNSVLGNRFDLKPSSDLYPTSGGSNDIHEANGILGLTLEIGRSFQPPASEIPKATAYITPANLVFIDEIKARFATT